MKKILYILCAVVLLTACDKDVHNDEYGLAVSLAWFDAADADTPIDDVKLWIYTKSGERVIERGYASAQELALQRFDIPAGDYVVITAVNLTTPFTVEEATASAKPYEALTFALSDSGANPAHAFYGVAELTMPAASSQIVCTALRRVLSELTVKIEDAPEGITLDATVNHIADGMTPYSSRATGGRNSITIPSATTRDGAITTVTMRLMPTTAADTHSSLHFTLTHPDGVVNHCDVDAPVMTPSGKYTVTVKYNDLQAYMNLDVVTINDWEEYWVINGEILNPNK